MYQKIMFPPSVNLIHVETLPSTERTLFIHRFSFLPILLAILGSLFSWQQAYCQNANGSTSTTGVGNANYTTSTIPDPYVSWDQVQCGTTYWVSGFVFEIVAPTSQNATIQSLSIEIIRPDNSIIIPSYGDFKTLILNPTSSGGFGASNPEPSDVTAGGQGYLVSGTLALPHTISQNSTLPIWLERLDFMFCTAGLELVEGEEYVIHISASGVEADGTTFQVDTHLDLLYFREAGGDPAGDPSRLGMTQSSHVSSHSWYPNPSSNQATVTFDLEHKGSVDLGIYTIQGQRVLHPIQEETLSAGNHSYSLEVSTLPAGVYITKIQTSQGQEIFKWIKSD